MQPILKPSSTLPGLPFGRPDPTTLRHDIRHPCSDNLTAKYNPPVVPLSTLIFSHLPFPILPYPPLPLPPPALPLSPLIFRPLPLPILPSLPVPFLPNLLPIPLSPTCPSHLPIPSLDLSMCAYVTYNSLPTLPSIIIILQQQ